jgi:hypothetical protein
MTAQETKTGGRQTQRAHVVLIVAELDTGLGFHFCNHPTLSGQNSGLWFPLNDEKTLHAAVEKVMVMNHAAHNVVRIEPLSKGDKHADYCVIYNDEIRFKAR